MLCEKRKVLYLALDFCLELTWNVDCVTGKVCLVAIIINSSVGGLLYTRLCCVSDVLVGSTIVDVHTAIHNNVINYVDHYSFCVSYRYPHLV